MKIKAFFVLRDDVASCKTLEGLKLTRMKSALEKD